MLLASSSVVTCRLGNLSSPSCLSSESLSLSRVGSPPSLCVPPCAALILPFTRRMGSQSESLVPKQGISFNLPDMSLIRLNCDAVATPFNDTIQYSCVLLKVCVFLNHLILDLVFSRYLFDECFHHRPLSADCRLRTRVVSICSPLMQSCHTHGHALLLVNLRSLSVDGSSSSQFCAVSRVPHKAALQQPAHVLVTCLVILQR